MRKLLLSLLLISNIIVSAFGQKDSTMNLSLKQAREYAFEHNYDLINAKLDIYKAKKKVWETTAMGLPQANAEFSHNYNIDIPQQPLPAKVFDPNAPEDEYVYLKFGTDHNSKLNLTVSQLIFSGDYIVGLRSAKIYKNLSETQKDITRNQVIKNIDDAYYACLIVMEQISVLRSTLESTEKLLEETKKTYEAGLVEETAYDQLRVSVMTLENNLISVERQIGVAHYLLKLHMGLDFNVPINLTDSLDDIIEEVDVTKEVSADLVLNSQLDYKLLNVNEDLMKQAVNLQKVSFLPTISAFYSNQNSLMGNDFELFKSSAKWLPANIVGVSVKLPLFTSGSRLAKLSQAKVDLKKVQNSKELLAQSLNIQLLTARKDLLDANETLAKDKLNIKLTKKIYDQSMIKFKEGVMSSTDLTQNQQQYFSSLNMYYQSVSNLLAAKNSLNKLLNNYEQQ